MNKFRLDNLASMVINPPGYNPEFREECIKIASVFKSPIVTVGLYSEADNNYIACIFVECAAQDKAIVGMNKNPMCNLNKNMTGLINSIRDLESLGVKTYLSNSILNTNGDVILESALTALGWKKLYQKCADSLPEVYLYTRECNELYENRPFFSRSINSHFVLDNVFAPSAIVEIDRNRSIITVSVDQYVNINLLKYQIKDVLLQEFESEADYPMIFQTVILTGIFDKKCDADFYQFESIK